jgi:transposase
LKELQVKIGEIERVLHAWHRSNEVSRRLETIPGVGPITASALAVTITDPTLFRSGRHLAAWLGLVPRQNSSGGKERLGGISKQGDRYIRRLLISGAHAVLQYAKMSRPGSQWTTSLLQRRPFKLVAVALANLGGPRTRRDVSVNARGLRRLRTPAKQWFGGAEEVMTNGRTGIGPIR